MLEVRAVFVTGGQSLEKSDKYPFEGAKIL